MSVFLLLLKKGKRFFVIDLILVDRLNILHIFSVLFSSLFYCREREREMYGPKKRGPKPETFLMKVKELHLHVSFFLFVI